jgi:outer membrane lipopolysaccharide assembly protein LptE/RlpB
MTKKILTIILTIFILGGCGYAPIYKNLENVNFSINIQEFSGDRTINNKIKSKLTNYTVNEREKKFNISFNSKYKKNIVAKDTTGAATEFKIIIETEFEILSSNLEQKLKLVESFNMQKINDKLDEQDYEESIKDSLTSIIARKLILRLSQLQ